LKKRDTQKNSPARKSPREGGGMGKYEFTMKIALY